MRFPFAVIPKIQFFSRARDIRSTEQDRQRLRENVAARIHAQFPARRNNRFAQNFEASKSSQRKTEIDFFADKKLLIESTARIEVFAGSKKKRTGTEIHGKINRAESRHEDAAPSRDFAVHGQSCAAANVTGFQRRDGLDHMPRVDPGVGIDKKQNASARRVRSRVPGRGNLPAIDRNNLRAKSLSEIRGCIRRSIIDHDDFVIFLCAACGGLNRADRRRNFQLLVESRNDERNHSAKLGEARRIDNDPGGLIPILFARISFAAGRLRLNLCRLGLAHCH